MYNSYLIHHGVKGMRWGVRKYNPKYTKEQRLRDKAMYGRGGVRRINKSMNKGTPISGARSIESSRINAARRQARLNGQLGAMIGSVGGSIGGLVLGKYVSDQYINRGEPYKGIVASAAVGFGASAIGTQIGRYGGQSITMISKGYSPRKFR